MGEVVYGTDFRRHLNERKQAPSDEIAILRGMGLDPEPDTAPAEYVAPDSDPA